VLNADASVTGPGPVRLAPPSDPVPLQVSERGLSWWIGTGISVAILVAVLLQLRTVDFGQVRALVPTSPLFWLVFFLSYFASPAADWIIYRRLWNIPLAGFAALVRKLVGNELLFGYVGELYLYTWARRRTEMTSTPFGAIKDVSILSAMTANAVTLALMALAYPLLGTLHLDIDSRALLISVAVVAVSSAAILLFRKTLFSLPRRELRFVTGVHLVRIMLTTGLAALCWHLALPGVDLQWWLFLATLRMLLSRLPLLPNKDIVFAALAVFIIGRDAEIGALMTMMATLTLATHVIVGTAMVTTEAVGWKRR
jgi:hypothetical protein